MSILRLDRSQPPRRVNGMVLRVHFCLEQRQVGITSHLLSLSYAIFLMSCAIPFIILWNILNILNILYHVQYVRLPLLLLLLLFTFTYLYFFYFTYILYLYCTFVNLFILFIFLLFYSLLLYCCILLLCNPAQEFPSGLIKFYLIFLAYQETESMTRSGEPTMQHQSPPQCQPKPRWDPGPRLQRQPIPQLDSNPQLQRQATALPQCQAKPLWN